MTSERFPRSHRITDSGAYRRILGSGRKYRSAAVDFFWLANDAGHPRLGLVVPKFQSSAVARNRLRRRLKEIWRRAGQEVVGSVDLIIRARRESYEVDSADLKTALLEWTQRLGRACQ